MSDFLIEKYLPKFYRQFSTTITSDYILSPGDAGSTVIADSSSNGITVEVPNDLVVNFAVGTVIWIYRDGLNPVFIKGDTGVTVNPSEALIKSDHAEVRLRKQAANEWVVGNNSSFSGFISATGGTVSDITVGGVDYRVHAFTTVGTSTFEVTSGGGEVEYLVVAGGGGSGGSNGSSSSGGGGGAGGFLSGSVLVVSENNYSIVVGSGGLGGTITSGLSGGAGSAGSNSSAFGQTSIGGGGGGGRINTNGGNGGSGGGANAVNGTAGSGTAGQGNDGGDLVSPKVSECSGGGGGASEIGGSAGADVALNTTGRGGNGSQWVDGNFYAGGGGGSTVSPSNYAALGGLGGGGNGNANGAGQAGLNGTGGGAGGGINSAGSTGGSGIVIIRYPI